MTKLILHHLKYRIYIRTKKDDQIHSINKENTTSVQTRVIEV